MYSRYSFRRTAITRGLSLLAAAGLLAGASSYGQIVFGIDTANNLFSFNVATPATTTTIGPTGQSFAGIDFNPADGTLLGIVIGAVNTQLFSINRTTGASTPIGTGFTSVGTTPAAYNLSSTSNYGFDVNPKTFQADSSIRIRLVSDDGDDLRLNSSTGQIAAVDPALNGAVTSAVGTAYLNNFAATSGTTTLFQIDATTDMLYTQNPPNNGLLVVTGPLGINAQSVTGFDIFTTAGETANTAYLATDATAAAGAELYTVNLTTGAATLVGNIGAGLGVRDIAVQPIPEPGSVSLIGLALVGIASCRRQRSARTVQG